MKILRKILNSTSKMITKFIMMSVCAIICITYLASTYADINDHTNQQIEAFIKQTIPHNELNISASHEVVLEINHIIHSFSSIDDIRNAIKRMNELKATITQVLQNKKIPVGLMVLPIVESEYKQSLSEHGSSFPAGIWQMVPDTARKYGLIINGKRDDRLNPQLETVAISNYLNDLYHQFHDWRLVIIAYKLGDVETSNLLNKVKSHDPIVLLQSSYAPADLKKYITKIDSIVIIMHNPALIGLK